MATPCDSSGLEASINNRISAAFEAVNIRSVREAAFATGIHPVTLWRRSRNAGGLKLEELVAISKATGVSVVDLVGGAQ